MEFALHYRGKLVPDGTAPDKHSLRQYFHPQIKKFWTDKDSPMRFTPAHYQTDAREKRGAFEFLPLIADWNNLLAELEITLLRPQAPGSIVHGGDIDNRLKTLFDAMAIP